MTHRGPVAGLVGAEVVGGAVVGAVGGVLVGAVGGAVVGAEPDDDVTGAGSVGVDVGSDWPLQWTRTELAGQFGAAATVTWVSFPDARQA